MKLLESTQLGNKKLKNRMAMAPMTGSRTNIDGSGNHAYINYPFLPNWLF